MTISLQTVPFSRNRTRDFSQKGKNMSWRHGGNLDELSLKYGLPPESIIDFSANINPFGPPDWLRMTISSAVSSLVNYPDPYCLALRQKIAKKYGIPVDEITVGNGSSALLCFLPAALKAGKTIIAVPSYADYEFASKASGLHAEFFPVSERTGFRIDFDLLEKLIEQNENENLLVILGYPNNPTGILPDPERFGKTVSRFPDVFFLVDEAFGDFVTGFESFVFNRPSNMIVLKSMTKIFAIPGIRIGYLAADSCIIKNLERIMPAWSVGHIEQLVGESAIDDIAFVNDSRKHMDVLRCDFFRKLSSVKGLKVYEGQANFLLLKILKQGIDSEILSEKLLKKHIAIRKCSDFRGLDSSFFRIAVKSEDENFLLYELLSEIFGQTPVSKKMKKTPALMIQGTASNAGKSILSAAFCRIMAQDGFRTAPFKAQNMSLNSFVTKDGLEMATAQAVQARACMIDPDVRMNPVLVKPSSDVAGQIVINGRPAGIIRASGYFDYRKVALEAIHEAYDSISSEFDVMIIEGAGSPAEVNLKKNDITNMNMAFYAEAPVLIAGDIDRGGVFASFIGCMETFTEKERRLVAGFLVNRFRGDEKLLGDALDYMKKHTGKKVLGVIPFIKNLMLPEEDSVVLSREFWSRNKNSECVEICVINLPHFSNFTDFDAFRTEKDVVLKLAGNISEIENPDALIIPGSKNVIADMKFLEDTGIASRIRTLASSHDCLITGICGGYQMLGITLEDPCRIESGFLSNPGLGLLDVHTVLEKEKQLRQINACHIKSGEKVSGYEIHHGRTFSNEPLKVLETEGAGDAGAESRCGRISGVYMHGFFDSDGFRRWFINGLRQKKGLCPGVSESFSQGIEKELDRLADIVRACVDMKNICQITGL